MKKLFFVGLLLIGLSFLSPKSVFAATLFQDDFSDGNPTGWEEHLGSQGSWSVQNQEYVGRVVKDRPQDLPTYSIMGDENWGDYKFDVRIRGDTGVDKLILFRYHSLNQTYAIKLVSSWWDWYGDKIALLKNNLISWTTSAPYINHVGTWYKLTVETRGPNIKVYIDDSTSPIINFTDEVNPNLTGKIGLLVWPGFYGGYGSVTVNTFDDISVSSLEPTHTLNNIILLPGLGASWNYDAMVLRQERQPENWEMTPGIKIYDGFIQTLKNSGYTLNENLFVFNYDWRKPVDEIANDLKNYIVRHPPPSGTKIDLVGHSLGGLVARAYVQRNPENQTEKIITVGSPHKGSVKAYYLWEGADLSSLNFWQQITAGALLKLNKNALENDVETIQRVVPSLRNTLPTFAYLKKKGIEKPLFEMIFKNDWLENLNSLPLSDSFIANGKTTVGLKGNTLRWINTADRSLLDKLLGKWADGTPIGENYDMGDNTVLSESAKLPEINTIELTGLNHSELMETVQGQQAITDFLELHPSELVPAPVINYSPALVFLVASPATVTVFDPNNQKIREGEKFTVITDPIQGNYRVQVSPEGSGGDYRLLTGKILSSGGIWTETSDTISPGQTKDYSINLSLQTQTNKLDLANLAKNGLLSAKQKAESLPSPTNNTLSRLIQFRVQEASKIHLHLQKGMTKIANDEIKQAILGLDTLIKNIKQQTTFTSIPENQKTEIINLIYEAKDYFIQAYQLK